MTEAKTFSSKSLSHIASYSVVKSITGYVLSFALLNTVYQQLAAYAGLFNEKVVSQNVTVVNYLTLADDKFDTIVLAKVDELAGKIPDLSPYYPSALYASAVTKLNGKVLGPLNSKYYSFFDKYLPATLTENKPVFKIHELAEGTSTSITSEFVKFFNITNEFLTRFKLYITSKSNTLSDEVIATYNKEFEKLAEEGNYYYKSGQASYNTSVSLINNVNSSYIQPYVNETKKKADTFITDTKSRASFISTPSISISINAGPQKSDSLLNGAAPVSASA